MGELWESRHDQKMSKVHSRLKRERPLYYFREWRKYRGYTQETLADMIGVTASSISQLETGKQGFTDATLESLAYALRCSPGDLLMRDPLDKEAPYSIWSRIPLKDRARVLELMRVYAVDDPGPANGTDG